MSRQLTFVLVLLAALIPASPASASRAEDLPRLALHAPNIQFKNPCAYRPNTEALAIQHAALPFENVFAFVFVCNGPAVGISGLQFGIDYPGVFNPNGDENADIVIFGFTSCGYLSFDSAGWPAPGTGTLISWYFNDCQLLADTGGGTFANAGYFYLTAYHPGAMRIVPRPSDHRASVADCSNVSYDITNVLDGGLLGSVGFGPTAGYNPCAASVSVEPTTWGRIKAVRGRSE